MSRMKWEYQPSLYRQALEHFFTSRAPFDIPCIDTKAATAARHGLHRYFHQTVDEASAGNPEAARLAVVIPEIMVTKRETIVVVALRSERINVDFEKMAEAVALRRREAEALPERQQDKKNTYY